jgi:ferric-dicitrate binding protein FerR (iron transport regulator)
LSKAEGGPTMTAVTLRDRFRSVPRRHLWLGATAAALVLMLALWLLARSIDPGGRPAPYTPGVEEQRTVTVGGDELDLEELERASREADAVARQLEAELGRLDSEPSRSR